MVLIDLKSRKITKQRCTNCQKPNLKLDFKNLGRLKGFVNIGLTKLGEILQKRARFLL